MRVALIHSRYSDRVPSGENVVVDSEVEALARAGADVKVFQTDPAVVRAGKAYPAVAAMRVASGRGRSFRDDLARFQPDVLHVHNVFPDLAERTVADLPYPMVLTIHNYRLSCAAGTHFRGSSVCGLCIDHTSLMGVRFGCHHGLLGTIPLTIAHRHGPARNPLVIAAAEVWSPSRFHLDRLAATGLPTDRARVRPHFIPDRDLRNPPAERGDGAVFAGRLEPEKGVLELADAWPRNGPTLRIFGDGSLRSELQHRAAGRNIEVMGRLSRPEVLAEMAHSRFLVFSSTWWEPFGLVAIEAMAMGLPVISIGRHAASEIVVDRASGVSIDSVESLSAAVDSVLSRSPEEWASELRTIFGVHYSESMWVDRRLADYERVAR